eukprot:gb/GECH01011589.1/.p1 GENE.gb/GECH01011589.1/~~gb/GECH01011589.1/.p1  ORF type:complete len:1167 (+),score=362.92 gb/GECH01011589.1/:1-3501(+)
MNSTSLDEPKRNLNATIVNTGEIRTIPIYFDTTLNEIKEQLQTVTSSFSNSFDQDDILIFDEKGNFFDISIPSSNVKTIFVAIKNQNPEIEATTFSPEKPPSKTSFFTPETEGNFELTLSAAYSFAKTIQNNVTRNQRNLEQFVKTQRQIFDALSDTLTQLHDPLKSKIRELIANISSQLCTVDEIDLDDQYLKNTQLPDQFSKKYCSSSAHSQYSNFLEEISENGNLPSKVKSNLLDHLTKREDNITTLNKRLSNFHQNEIKSISQKLESAFNCKEFEERLQEVNHLVSQVSEMTKILKKDTNNYLNDLNLVKSLNNSEQAEFWNRLSSFLEKLQKNYISPLEDKSNRIHDKIVSNNTLRMTIQSDISHQVTSFCNIHEQMKEFRSEYDFLHDSSQEEFEKKYPSIRDGCILSTVLQNFTQEIKRRSEWNQEIINRQEKYNQELEQECSSERDHRYQIQNNQFLRYKNIIKQYSPLAEFFARALNSKSSTSQDTITLEDILNVDLPCLDNKLNILDSLQSSETQDAKEMAEISEFEIIDNPTEEKEEEILNQKLKRSNGPRSGFKESAELLHPSCSGSENNFDSIHSDSSSRVAMLQKELEEKQDTILNLENELKNMKRSYEESIEQNKNHYQSVIQQDKNQHNTQVEDLQQQIKTLNVELEKQERNNSELKNSINDFKKQEEKFSTDAEEKSKEIDNLNEKLQEQNKQFENQIESKDIHISSLTSKLEHNEKDMAQLSIDYAQVKKQLQETEEQLNQKLKSNETLDQKIKTLESNLNDLSIEAQDNENLGQELNSTKTELEEAKTKILNITQTNDKLENDKARVSQELMEVKKALENMTKSREENMAKLQEYESKLSSFEKTFQAMEKNSQKEVDQLNQTKQSLEEKISGLNKFVEEIQDKNQNYKDEISVQNHEISNLKQKLNQATNEKEQATKQANQLREELDRVIQETQAKCSDLEHLDKKVKELKQEINRLQHNKDITENKLKKQEQTTREVQENLVQARDDIKQLEKENGKIREQHGNNCNETEKLREYKEQIASLHQLWEDIFGLPTPTYDDIQNKMLELSNFTVSVLSDKPEPEDRLLFIRHNTVFIALRYDNGPVAILETADLPQDYLTGYQYVIGKVVMCEEPETAREGSWTGLPQGVQYYMVYASPENNKLRSV